MTTCTRTFPGRRESAADARRWAACALAGCGCPNADAVVLVVSEMITNSIRHSRSASAGAAVEVRIAIAQGAWVRVAVRDEGPLTPPGFRDSTGADPNRMPVTKPGLLSEGGRGWWLCSELADECGSNGRGLYWCRLPWDTTHHTSAVPASPAEPWQVRWQTVMERAKWRCECSGQCGRAGHCCPVGHAPGYPLQVVPASPAGDAAAASLPASALIALCTACRTGADKLTAARQAATGPEPAALFPSPPLTDRKVTS